jgi:F-type H+-transporting ATPase subunit b
VQLAVIHLQGSVVVPQQAAAPTAEVADPSKPGPIVPEVKELAWGAGSFVVFAILMRFVLFPRLKKGMDARYGGIRNAHATAESDRAAARAEVVAYEQQIAAVKAEAAGRVDAARQTLETERQSLLATANATINERRVAAAAQADQVRAAAKGQIHAAVVTVAGRAGELATGRAPSAEMVERAVSEVMAS